LCPSEYILDSVADPTEFVLKSKARAMECFLKAVRTLVVENSRVWRNLFLSGATTVYIQYGGR